MAKDANLSKVVKEVEVGNKEVSFHLIMIEYGAW